MTNSTRNLMRLLPAAGASHAFAIAQTTEAQRLDDEPVDLVITQQALLKTHRGELAIELLDRGGRDARAILDRCPGSVWICQLGPDQRQGTITPFAPPRVTRLEASIPLLIRRALPDAVRSDARALGLCAGQDALRGARFSSGRREVVVLGQRTISALSEQDGRTLTLWMCDGSAAEMTLVLRDGRAHLELLHLVRPGDHRDAHCGPSVILELGPRARLPVIEEEEDEAGEVALPRTPAEEVLCFQPRRSPILDVWAQYIQLTRETEEARDAARAAKPLHYEEAHQRGKRWIAETRLDPAEQAAWLSRGAGHRHEVRVDQRVELYVGDEQEPTGALTVEKMKLIAPERAQLTLRPDRALKELPSTGRLRAVRNPGSEEERRRQREALEALLAGQASCPNLIHVLNDPALATPPRTVSVPGADLDSSQRRALAKILGCEDLVAIQGPPGTGKTRVIVAALKHLAARGTRERPIRVLISSVQNEAINNVAERLSGDRILVHQLRRADRDQDEGHAMAAHDDSSRDQILGLLAKRLQGSHLLAVLDSLRDWLAGLGRLRVLAAERDRVLECAQELTEFCARADLPTVLMQEGRRLAERLREEATAAPTEGAAVAQPERAAAFVEPVDPAPASAEDTATWWERRRGTWPIESRAEVQAAVRGVVDASAGAEKNPVRYGERKQRLFAALQSLLAGIPSVLPRQPQTPAPARLADGVEAWLASAEQELLRRERPLLEHPDAISRRFLVRLREDPVAWQEIRRRHSTVVAATCSMSAKARRDGDEPYDWVIIDEAGRASPFELLVAMVQGRRVVLIGDHRQLPPMVEDDVADALERARALEDADGRPPQARSGVDIRTETLFGALYDELPAACRERLSVQYRMHGDIGEVVDLLFYRPHNESLDSFHAGPRAHERRPLWGVKGDRPLVFMDTADRPGASPYENENECEVVLSLLQEYAESTADPARPIPHVGVICAYAFQRDRIERALSTRPDLRDPSRLRAELKTIDAVQGREYPIVLFCTVRRDGRPGFLATENRVNVAISRAQRQLVILGSQRALSDDRLRRDAPHLAQLLELCRHRDIIVTRDGGRR